MINDTRIGIVGLGLMGCSIAACLLASGHSVTAVVNQNSDIKRAGTRILRHLEELNKAGEVPIAFGRLMDKLTVTDDLHRLTGHGLVLESISENTAEKKHLFLQLEAILAEDAIIASNTSAIPITELQASMKLPARLFGLHWGEPAHTMKFMEVICGAYSDLECAGQLVAMAQSWGKDPSLVKKDIRGFISNRLMYAMIREALYLVDHGYATIEDVDRACRNDLGHWITFAGPFRFMDLTGVSAYLKVMEDLFPELSDSNVAPEFVKEMIKQGDHGIRTGQGFYSYTKESALNWERLFFEFTLQIRKLSDQYPQNVGEL